MVYLNIYDSIFEYLEEIGLIDDVFFNAEAVLDHLLQQVKNNTRYNELVAEFSLFNYMCNEQLLINFLYENLYPKLNDNDKKEFELINESKRVNLRFEKKEPCGKLGIEQLYDFYFQDIDNNDTKIILSSTALDKFKYDINARLIKSPEHENKYSIIGGIYDQETFEAICFFSALKLKGNKSKEIEDYRDCILEFSKTHTLEEIDRYNDERSLSLEQDKQIMKMNRNFFERFNLGFDDFLENFLDISNDKNKFIEMVDYYLSIADDLKETMLDTDYYFSLELLDETSLIKGFSAFMRNDKKEFRQCLIEIKNETKEGFEISLKNNLNFSREGIMKNNKEYLHKKIAPLKLNGFDQFIKKLDTYSAEEIELFFTDIISYFEPLINNLVAENIGFFLITIKTLSEHSKNIPFKDEIINGQKDMKYDPDKFYEYISVSDRLSGLFIFMLIVDCAYNKDIKKAHRLIKENNIKKNRSFDMMFLLGKILSFYDDKDYRSYFNCAKKIDRQRYKSELKTFLDQKEENNVWTGQND